MAMKTIGWGRVICTAVVSAVLGGLGVAQAADVGTFAKVCPITISGYTGTSTLENFPVLVRIPAGSAVYANCASGGSDLRFTDEAGNMLSHEIESWDMSGESLLWVKVPSLEGTNTRLMMYMNGTPTAEAEVDAQDVWTNHPIVIHYASLYPSSANPDNSGSSLKVLPCQGALSLGTVAGAPMGKVLDSTNGYGLKVDNADAWAKHGGTFSMSTWMYRTDVSDGSNRAIFSESGKTFTSYYKPSASAYYTAAIGAETALAHPAGTWIQITEVYDGTDYKLYENGELRAQKTITALSDTAGYFSLASTAGGYLRCKGYFDETRFHLAAESADWVKATYDASANEAFAVLGGVMDNDSSKPMISVGSARLQFNTFSVSGEVLSLGTGASSATVKLKYGTTQALDQEVIAGENLAVGGTFSATLPNLAFTTTYYYAVEVTTDAETSASTDVDSFTTSEDPYLKTSEFSYVCDISFNGYTGTETLNDFPALVRIPAGSEIYTTCAEDGSDIRFADDNGFMIPHEFDTWNAAGESLIWVKVPELSAGTVIHMYFGGSPSQSVTDTDVWSDFPVVLHYAAADNANGLYDSSAKHLTVSSTSGGGSTAGTGPVGTMLDTVDSFGVNVAYDASWGWGAGATRSFSTWFKAASSFDRFILGDSQSGFYVKFNSTSFTMYVSGTQVSAAATTTEWNYLTAVSLGNSVALYVNGVKLAEAAKALPQHTSGVMYFGAIGTSNRPKGYQDEARIHNAEESADWVLASYQTVASANFATLGDVRATSAQVPLTVRTTSLSMDGLTATIAGRLANLGTGATSASVKLYWSTTETVDASCNAIDLGSFSDKADLEAILTNLTPAGTYYYAFCAVNNAAEPETVWTDVESFTVEASTKVTDKPTVTCTNCKMTISATVTEWGIGTTKAELLIGTSAEDLSVVDTIDGLTEMPEDGVITFAPVTRPVGTYVYVVRVTTTYGEIVWVRQTPVSNMVTLADTATYTYVGGTGTWSDRAMWTTEEDGAGGYPSAGCSVVFGEANSDVIVDCDLSGLTNIEISSVGTHVFRTASSTKQFSMNASGTCTLVGEGGGTLVFDNITLSKRVADLAGLKTLVICGYGSVYPANSETTDVMLVNGGQLAGGWDKTKTYAKLILRGGPCRITSSDTFSFASLELQDGSGVSCAVVGNGKISFRDPRSVELVGGTQTLADATAESPIASQIPVAPAFAIVKSGFTGYGLCTVDADGVVQMIPESTMLTSFEGATALDNVCIDNTRVEYEGATRVETLAGDVTVNAALFAAAGCELNGHTITVKSGAFREGEKGLWANCVSNGVVKLCKPSYYSDGTNNSDLRMRVAFATEGNADIRKPMLTQAAANVGWPFSNDFAQFTGVMTTPVNKEFFVASSHFPKMVLEMRGTRLTAQGVTQKANWGGLMGEGGVTFNYNGQDKYGCNIWLGEMSEEDQSSVDDGTVNGTITVGTNGILCPGLVGYDGGRRGTISLVYQKKGNIPMMDTVEVKAGGTFVASVNVDGTCGVLDATETAIAGSYISVKLDGKLDVTATGPIAADAEFPIIKYREDKRTGRFATVTDGFKVNYDVLQPDGTYAVTVCKKNVGFILIVR